MFYMERLDIYLYNNNYYESRKKAQDEIEAGNVCVDGKIINKPSFKINDNSKIEIVGSFCQYVSRAGLKLEGAKKQFGLDFKNKIVLDIGASTGGFTDFCIKNEAKKVFAVDVGSNQLHHVLKENPKVVNMEKTDIRDVELEEVDMAVSDVSFISLTKIAPKIATLIKSGGEFVALIKPQFECGKELAKKCRGVIKDAKVHEMCKNKVIECYVSLGFRLVGVCPSPILGGDGNLEFLSYFVILSRFLLHFLDFFQNIVRRGADKCQSFLCL